MIHVFTIEAGGRLGLPYIDEV